LARSFQIAADEMTKLAPFIDDLDGVGGGDCDTGTNARVTFQTLAHGCEQLSDSDPLSVGLDCAIQSGIRGALGHCGVLLVSILSSWHSALDDASITPVVLRRMLLATPSALKAAHAQGSATDAMLREACSELEGLGDTLPEVPQELSAFCAAAQFGLVEATGLPAPPSTPVQRSLRSCSALSMLPAATIWGCSNLLLQCLRNWRGMEATVSVPMPRRLIAHSQSMSFFKEPLMMSMLSVASLTLWGRVIPGPGMPTSSDWASGASTSILPHLCLSIPNVVGRFASMSLMLVPMKQLESIPLPMA